MSLIVSGGTREKMARKQYIITVLLFTITSLLVAAFYSASLIAIPGGSSGRPALLCLLMLFLSLVVTFWGLSQVLFKNTFYQWLMFVDSGLRNDRVWVFTLLAAAFLIYESIQDMLFLGTKMNLIHYQEYRRWIGQNLMIFFWILCGSMLVFSYIVNQKRTTIAAWLKCISVRGWIRLFGIGLVAILILEWSKMGISLESRRLSNFQPLNTPLIGLQVGLVFGALLLGRFIYQKWLRGIKGIASFLSNEIFVILMIWLAAFAFWMLTPTGPNAYVDQPRPPNQELYPTSDSVYYDIQANRYLLGEGFSGINPDIQSTPRHPLYLFFLSFLHAAAGPDYSDLVPLMVALLSLTPVVLYKLISKIHDRFTGAGSECIIYTEREEWALSQ